MTKQIAGQRGQLKVTFFRDPQSFCSHTTSARVTHNVYSDERGGVERPSHFGQLNSQFSATQEGLSFLRVVPRRIASLICGGIAGIALHENLFSRLIVHPVRSSPCSGQLPIRVLCDGSHGLKSELASLPGPHHDALDIESSVAWPAPFIQTLSPRRRIHSAATPPLARSSKHRAYQSSRRVDWLGAPNQRRSYSRMLRQRSRRAIIRSTWIRSGRPVRARSTMSIVLLARR